MAYSAKTYTNGSGLALNDDNLNSTEQGIEEAHDLIETHALDTTGVHGITDTADLIVAGVFDPVSQASEQATADIAALQSSLVGFEDDFEVAGSTVVHDLDLTSHQTAGFLGVMIYNDATSAWVRHPLGLIWLRKATDPDPTDAMSTYDIQINGSVT